MGKPAAAQRLKAAAVHLGASALVALLAAALIFGLWYPAPYGEMSGGRELFGILLGVDVMLGPLVTLIVFNVRKPRRELRRDIAVVVLLQLAALAYGVWTVLLARPVHLVFEFDRLRVVHAIEVPAELLPPPDPSIRVLPLTGPTALAVRPFRDVNEEATATFMALQGLPLAARPDLWQPYEQARERVLHAAQSLQVLRQRVPPGQQAQIDAAVARCGRTEAQLRYLPVSTRKAFWTALLDAQTAQVCAFLPIDSF
jgi:hypothetical protein